MQRAPRRPAFALCAAAAVGFVAACASDSAPPARQGADAAAQDTTLWLDTDRQGDGSVDGTDPPDTDRADSGRPEPPWRTPEGPHVLGDRAPAVNVTWTVNDG
jgi:hypothetical protein